MKDYYTILEVADSATADQIKKSYRSLSKKYHPDLNPGDARSENKFKEIAEAYDVLGDSKKRKKYDESRRPKSRGTSFEDWVNDFGKRGDFGRGRGGFNRASSKPTSSKYLDISETIEVDLVDLLNGISIKRDYKKWTVNPDFIKSEIEKSISVQVDLTKKNLNISRDSSGKYSTTIKLSSLGHEDFHRRTNVWGDPEGIVVYGDYLITINVTIPEHIEIKDNNIIHWVDIPLYKTLFKGEKVRITTLFDKTYEAEISSPKKINDLKFNIKNSGILGKSGNILGNYIIKFNVIPPDLSKVPNKELDILKRYLIVDSD